MNLSQQIEDTFFQRLQDYSISRPQERLMVQFATIGNDQNIAERLLSLPYCASVVLPARNVVLATKHGGRVGWIDHIHSDYQMPEETADTLWRWNIHSALPNQLWATGVSGVVYSTNLTRSIILVSPYYQRFRDLLLRWRDTSGFSRIVGAAGALIEEWVQEFFWTNRIGRLLQLAPEATEYSDFRGIVLVTNTLGAGGSERQVTNTARGVIRATDEGVKVVCLSPQKAGDDFYRERIESAGIEVIELPSAAELAVDGEFEDCLTKLWIAVGPSDGIIEDIIRLTAEFGRSRPRVVHSWLDSVNVAAGIAAKLSGVPFVVLSGRSLSPIHFDFLQPYMRPVYRILAVDSHVQLLNNSMAGAEDYTRWLGIDRKYAKVIRNGIDFDELAPPSVSELRDYREKIGLPEGSTVLGTIFRFTEEKRPMLWAEIAATVARERSDVRFLVIGEGPLRKQFETFASEHGFGNRLIAPGSEVRTALPLAVMDCLLLTSRVEGLPNVLLEAQAAGVPVVASLVGGAGEALRDGETGWAIEGDDPARYATRILQIFKDHAWRKNAVKRAKEFVTQDFGLNRMVDETMAVYYANLQNPERDKRRIFSAIDLKRSQNSESIFEGALRTNRRQKRKAIGKIRSIARQILPPRARYHLSMGLQQLSSRVERLDWIPRGEFRDTFANIKPLLHSDTFRDGPIVLTNNALAWGGVERQIVYTLCSLGDRFGSNVGLLCLNLNSDKEYNFFKPALADFRGFVRNAMSQTEAEQVLSNFFPLSRMRCIESAIRWMPGAIQDEIIRFLAEFVTLKPRIVHAWQDELSIVSAYAAAFAGVPRILVSARNMSPKNFPYYRRYMRDAYRDIAAFPAITMINNSAAGAADYSKWLGVASDRFVVKRNGIDPSSIKRASIESSMKLRQQLGIFGNALVVGSIFRFYNEKRPMLWIETAVEIAKRCPGTHFVVFGEGPLRSDVEAVARTHNISNFLHCPGTIEDVSLGISVFDVFLLTSMFEGTPNVVLEASLLGVPVVVTDAGGTSEAVDNGKTGFVVCDATPSALADKVIEALLASDWRSKVLAEGPQFVARRFGLDRMIAETLALYRNDNPNMAVEGK